MAGRGTTNDDFPFEPGEIIDRGGALYVVLANFGGGGRVQALGGETMVPNLPWGGEGGRCVRTGRRSVFVFGSNEQGRHGKGAAEHARLYRGAVYGLGLGPQGMSYALPTKRTPYETLPLERIAEYAREFLDYARDRPEITFEVTPVGTGHAGYEHEQVAPLFFGAPENCLFVAGWREIHREMAQAGEGKV